MSGYKKLVEKQILRCSNHKRDLWIYLLAHTWKKLLNVHSHRSQPLFLGCLTVDVYHSSSHSKDVKGSIGPHRVWSRILLEYRVSIIFHRKLEQNPGFLEHQNLYITEDLLKRESMSIFFTFESHSYVKRNITDQKIPWLEWTQIVEYFK